MGTSERPRLTVFRSVSHIYAQVVDDLKGETLVAASSVEPSIKGTFAKDVRGGNLKGAQAIGEVIAKRAIDMAASNTAHSAANANRRVMWHLRPSRHGANPTSRV